MRRRSKFELVGLGLAGLFAYYMATRKPAPPSPPPFFFPQIPPPSRGGGPEAPSGPEITYEQQPPVPIGPGVQPVPTDIVTRTLRLVSPDLDPRVGADAQLFWTYTRSLSPGITFQQSEAVRRARFPGFFAFSGSSAQLRG